MTLKLGPPGYLHHWSSEKLVHPRGGAFVPDNNTELTVHSDKTNPDRLQFRFVSKEGAGYYGYIEHVSSGKFVHPRGNVFSSSLNPANNTRLILDSNRHDASALFRFDEENMTIIHRSGKVWHPKGEDPSPGNTTSLILHEDQNDAGRFYFGELDGKPRSPYPHPTLSGHWELLKAFITPFANHSYSIKCKVGRSKSTSSTTHHAWCVSADIAKGYFAASARYSGFVEQTNSETWSEEKEETYTINVIKGQSVWVWRYVLSISQFSDTMFFFSPIMQDTDSPEKPEDLCPDCKKKSAEDVVSPEKPKDTDSPE